MTSTSVSDCRSGLSASITTTPDSRYTSLARSDRDAISARTRAYRGPSVVGGIFNSAFPVKTIDHICNQSSSQSSSQAGF